MGTTHIKLKDGRTVLVREFQIEDKEKLIQMYASLSNEAVRWAQPPYTREVIERWLGNLQNLIALVAFHGDRIIGHAQTFAFPHPRRRGTGDMLIYLHQDFHNMGLGTAMLTILPDRVKERELHKIGLYVVEDNKPAIRLYRKFGFEVEGTRRDAYLDEEGRYHNELIMGLILK